MRKRLLAVLALAALLGGLLWWIGQGGGEPGGGATTQAAAPSSAAPDVLHPASDATAGRTEAVQPIPPEPATPTAASGAVVLGVHAAGTLVRTPWARLRPAGSTEEIDWLKVMDTRRLDGLPPGRYLVETRGAGWSAEPGEVELRAGQELAVTLAPLSVIEGLVLGGGAPLPRATLLLEALAPRGHGRDYDISAEVFSGEVELAGGAFRLVGFELPGGVGFERLQVRARAPGWFEAGVELPIGETLLFAGAVIELRGSLLAGRVLAPGEAGEQPVAGAAVLLVDATTRLQDVSFAGGQPAVVDERGREIPPLATATTDERGEFAFPAHDGQEAAFAARLLVAADGWSPWLGPGLAIDPRAAPGWHEVLLEPGAALGGHIRVRLVPAADPAAAPEPAAQPRLVLLQPLDGSSPDLRGARGLEPRRVPAPDDPDHARWEFEAAGLAPGRWRATAQLDVAPPDGAPVLAPQALVQELVLAAGARAELAFAWPPESGFTLAGEVRLPEGFQPDLAEVALVPEGTWTLPVAGAPLRADGRFELAGVPPGAWAVFAFARAAGRLALTSWPVVVGPRTPPPMRLDASRPEVRVRVAEPLHGRRLLLTGTTGDVAFDTCLALGRTHLDPAPDGTASFFGLLPGRYTLAVEGAPGAGVDFELPPGREVVHVDVE